jgi:hypothetical protein
MICDGCAGWSEVKGGVTSTAALLNSHTIVDDADIAAHPRARLGTR